MGNCFLCDDFVGEENGDGGVKGFTIGEREICKSCLEELKHRLNQVEARAPIDREKQEETIEENEPEQENTEEQNPFSAKVTE
ncbi:MAG: hypothetical protein GX950_01810 [Candidatus Diapherotrites archaeon]|jgi:hypothetical protein|uniref:Uncharacterized protein n=1 Tax=Candidatus Iainarchaeum sp. TaxID=3101447 RepID=A0A7K4BZM6_9ARCH|nr:hypothetical protein [Candidatus Diapherotrites archaeon]